MQKLKIPSLPRRIRLGLAAVVGGIFLWLAAVPAAVGPGDEDPARIQLGNSKVAVVVPAEFRESGERILHELRRYGGDSVELVIGAGDLDEDLWESAHLIAVGNFQNNPVVRLLYHRRQAFLDAAFPGPEGFMVKTVVDPIGLGKHVVLVGGSDASGIRSAVDQFLELVGFHGASLPRLHAVRSRLLEPVGSPPPPVAWWTTTSTAPNVPSPEEIERLLQENRESYETGQGARALENMIRYATLFYFTDQPEWATLFRESILTYIDLAKQADDWDFSPRMSYRFRLGPLIEWWDLIETAPQFSPQDRQRISEALRDMAIDMSRQPRMDLARNPTGQIRHNGVTVAALALESANRYFRRPGKPVGISPETSRRWREITDHIFEGQRQSYRADDESGNYSWDSPMHTYDYFRGRGGNAKPLDFIRTLTALALTITDNRRDVVTLGDLRTYEPWAGLSWPRTAPVFSRAAASLEDPGFQWAFEWVTENKSPFLGLHRPQGVAVYAVSIPAEKPTDFLGIHSVLLDEAPLKWVRERAPKESWVPRMDQTYLDKLSMRLSFDPQDEYLLLDGTGTFGHGHDDANAILRLTWNDRLWVADLDYIRTLPRFHSSMEIIREGKTGRIPPLAKLAANEEFDRAGFVRTEVEDYNGTDWRRNIIWSKGSYFLVIDELTSRVSGDFDFRCFWQLVGSAEIRGRLTEVRQPGAYLHVASTDSSELSLSSEDSFVQRDWTAYPYSDGSVRVLSQRQVIELSAGESVHFVNLLYSRKEEDGRGIRAVPLAAGVALLEEDDGELAMVGVAKGGAEFGPVKLEAELFRIGSDSGAAVSLSALQTPDIGFHSSEPVHLEWEAGGRGWLSASTSTEVQFLGDWRALSSGIESSGTDRWLVAEGRHPIRMPELLQADGWRQLQRARRSIPDDRTPLSAPFDIQQLWAVEDGTAVTAVAAHQSEGWIVGLADGRLLTVSYNGDVRPFGERLPAAIGSILSISDLVVAGDAMANLTAFSPDGSVRWSHHLGEHRAQVESVVRIAHQQAPEGKRILVGTGGARVHAFSVKGENIWVSEIRFHGVSDLVTGTFDPSEGEAIVVGTVHHTPINVLDPHGREKWVAWSGVDGVELSALHHGDGTHGRVLLVAQLEEDEGPMILFGTETDEVYAVSPEGKMIWGTNVGGQVNALLTADLDGDRRLQVVAATDFGYVTGLKPTGERKWWRRLHSPISDAVVVSLPDSKKSAIAVGMKDGRVALVGTGGEILGLGESTGAIRYLMPGPTPESFLIATDTGTVSLQKLSR